MSGLFLLSMSFKLTRCYPYSLKASRMESNGQPNRIHVSQATADLLIAANKGHWLTPREEKVFAKGKGNMQTYFVDVKGTESVRSFGARHSLLLQEGHTSVLLDEAIHCFEKISRRPRSTRSLNVTASMLLDSDEEDSTSAGGVDQPLIEKNPSMHSLDMPPEASPRQESDLSAKAVSFRISSAPPI